MRIVADQTGKEEERSAKRNQYSYATDNDARDDDDGSSHLKWRQARREQGKAGANETAYERPPGDPPRPPNCLFKKWNAQR